MTRAFAALAGLAATLLLALPARGTSIADITAAPASFADQQVTVVGTVTGPPLGYQGQSVYTILEDGRKITVVSKGDAPAAGAHLEVTGKVGYRPPDEEFTFPPVIVETARAIAP
jgi:hypothetical protein